MRDCAGHCRTHRGQQSRESALNSLPSRRGGRAPPGHGGGHGRRPSAPHAATPGRHAGRRAAPARAPPAVAPAEPAGRGEELESWTPGNLEVCDARQVFQISRFPDSHRFRPARPSPRASAVRLHCPRHGGRRLTDTPAERGAESTWTRLRRRKVVQWGVAYAAGAWALLQVLEYFGGTFHWPEQSQQLTTLALLIGPSQGDQPQ